jgi:type IV pilus biogenesis protein CpaD/CtpE
MKLKSPVLLILAVLVSCLLTACAWEIFTRGHVESDTENRVEYRIFALDDSTALVVKSSAIQIDSVTYDLVEMEVGELLWDGEAGPDTILVDLRP